MTGHGAVDTLLLIAAVLAGVVTIATTGRKIWVFLDEWEDALTTLKGIATEFKTDHGQTLHDQIVTIQRDISRLQQDIESVIVERKGSALNVVRTEADVPDGTPV